MADDVDRRGLADVVGPGLEGEAEHRDPALGELAVERALDLGDEAAARLLIHLDCGAEQLEALPVIARRLVERSHVLGEARAAETKTRAEEGAADALVGADAVGDRAHIGAGELAELRHLVDERDLQRQERIDPVLDQLRAGRIGDPDRGVEMPEQPSHALARIGILTADDHLGRLAEVAHRTALGEELGTHRQGHDAAVAPAEGLQRGGGPRRDRALDRDHGLGAGVSDRLRSRRHAPG